VQYDILDVKFTSHSRWGGIFLIKYNLTQFEMERKQEKEENADGNRGQIQKSFFRMKIKSFIVVYKMYIGNISEEGVLLLGGGKLALVL